MSSPQLINLSLRDGQQSTLDAADWTFNVAEMAKVLAASRAAGFVGAELAGGQSFQIAIKCGVNPFTIVSSMSHALGRQAGSKPFSLQMLFRGANALGFRHYDRDVIEATLNEFIQAGITKIRSFDALNDIDNLELPESVKSCPGITLEAALCFTHYASAPERYSDAYYVNYAKALLDKGYNSIAIKDMSGQLTADRVATLVPALQALLKPRKVPLALHVHSTNSDLSMAALKAAAELGVDFIETVEGPLSGGSAHHSLKNINPDLIPDEDSYERLQRVSRDVWGASPQRRDGDIARDQKDKLSQGGVPGGAMPFVIRDLRQQESAIRAKFLAAHPEIDLADFGGFDQILDLFLKELRQVCEDVGLPLLVTPTADICCKQAITNLAMGARPYSEITSDRYLSASGQPNPDPRFAKLVLGYYGELKAYDENATIHGPSENFIQFFEAHNTLGLLRSPAHPSQAPAGTDLKEAQQAAWQLIQSRGSQALSFATFDQLTLMYALKPATSMNADPVAQAVDQYQLRSDTAKIDGRGHTFPGYKSLMKPIFEHLGPMVALDSSLVTEDLLELQLSDLGDNLTLRLYDIYTDLPIWSQVTQLSNHLSKLVSSSHISQELRTAVGHVGGSLDGLDLRPSKQKLDSLSEAREKFAQLSIGTLFSSLALISSFINDVAKYATNPTSYAEKALSLEGLDNYLKNREKNAEDSEWISQLKRSISSKHRRLQADLKPRIESWK